MRSFFINWCALMGLALVGGGALHFIIWIGKVPFESQALHIITATSVVCFLMSIIFAWLKFCLSWEFKE